MKTSRPIVVVAAALVAMLGAACGPKRVSGASRPAQALVVLLPDADTGRTGRAGVTNQAGSVDLAAERDATLTTANRKPGPVMTLSEAEVARVFGSALSALPAIPNRFTLYFRFESDELTDESHALVPDILSSVKNRSFPDVVIVGHTDTMGAPAANIELGLKRATTVRNLLVAAGLDPSTIEVTSHGEAELLVTTGDETPEPRNRRVEIAVR
jgi:outer membrane protein OmpA-like peptidoglycan-associated protein